MTDVEAGAGLSLEILSLFADVAVSALTATREEIDSLNVFPIPDGDTGTNMLLTMSAARDSLREAIAADEDDADVFTAFCRGALLGARGNSGVILAEIIGAVVTRLADPPAAMDEAKVLAQAFTEAADAAYAAVGNPVEGTILTVCRAAAEAATVSAVSTAAGEPTTTDVATAAASAAAIALAATPDQLPRLRDAGVVDAGGRGLTVLLEAIEEALTGTVRSRSVDPAKGRGAKQAGKHESRADARARRRKRPPAAAEGDLTPDGPAYEVMFLLDAVDEAVPALRETLGELGDSLVVTGRAGLFHIHIHTDDVGAVIEAGIAAGTPHRIRVTHFAQQAAQQSAAPGRRTRTGRAVVAIAAGKGLERIFADAGAQVVRTGPGKRPSVGQVLKAIERAGAAEVVVLPNDPDTLRVSQVAAAAARTEHGIRVEVVPSHAQVQGLAALAVHDSTRAFDRDVVEMTAAGSHARQGAVTVAVKRAITTAGTCETGDVLGVVDGDFVDIGDDLAEVAIRVLVRLLGAGGELVTLVVGEERGAASVAAAAQAWIEEHHPTIEVLLLEGGQARYPLLVGVE